MKYGTGDAAAKAKENLDGADIYSGCCTLSIDFAKVSLGLNLSCAYLLMNGFI